MENFVQNLEEMFYVSVSIEHNFDFNTNTSKTIRTIHAEIIGEIKQNTDKVTSVMNFAGTFMSFFFLWMLFK